MSSEDVVTGLRHMYNNTDYICHPTARHLVSKALEEKAIEINEQEFDDLRKTWEKPKSTQDKIYFYALQVFHYLGMIIFRSYADEFKLARKKVIARVMEYAKNKEAEKEASKPNPDNSGANPLPIVPQQEFDSQQMIAGVEATNSKLGELFKILVNKLPFSNWMPSTEGRFTISLKQPSLLVAGKREWLSGRDNPSLAMLEFGKEVTGYFDKESITFQSGVSLSVSYSDLKGYQGPSSPSLKRYDVIDLATTNSTIMFWLGTYKPYERSFERLKADWMIAEVFPCKNMNLKELRKTIFEQIMREHKTAMGERKLERTRGEIAETARQDQEWFRKQQEGFDKLKAEFETREAARRGKINSAEDEFKTLKLTNEEKTAKEREEIGKP